MIRIVLDSSEYTEALQFPDTEMGSKSIVEFEVVNPYGTRISILEFGSDDKDLEFIECPKFLDARTVGIVRVEYAPKRDRKESLNNKKLRWKIAL